MTGLLVHQHSAVVPVLNESASASPAQSKTLTLLFTDLEASTRLLYELGDAVYDRFLTRYLEIMHTVVGAHDGKEHGSEGDSIFASFASAASGLAAAMDAQLAMFNERWAEPIAPRIRVGVHTGDVRETGVFVRGLAVHEAARICAAARGGQTLVSATTASVANPRLQEGEFVDLGEHRLKDILEPMHLYELRVARLAGAAEVC